MILLNSSVCYCGWLLLGITANVLLPIAAYDYAVNDHEFIGYAVNYCRCLPPMVITADTMKSYAVNGYYC